MASLSIPSLPPAAVPVNPVTPAVVPTAAPALPVGPLEAILPVALLQAEIDGLPLPTAQPASGLSGGDGVSPGGVPDGAAMRPDQVAMARQLTWPPADGGALATAWRGMVRNYGTQLVARDLQSRPGQLPVALLLAGQEGRPQSALDPEQAALDAWRFTIHAGNAKDQHLRVIGEDDPDQPKKGPRQRRRRAALRLELVLADGSVVTVQAEPVADGVMLELCAPDVATSERLQVLQPRLEAAVKRAGLRVLGWTWRDSLPEGRVHARLPSTEAAAALSLPVFRAMAEMALLLPA